MGQLGCVRGLAVQLTATAACAVHTRANAAECDGGNTGALGQENLEKDAGRTMRPCGLAQAGPCGLEEQHTADVQRHRARCLGRSGMLAWSPRRRGVAGHGSAGRGVRVQLDWLSLRVRGGAYLLVQCGACREGRTVCRPTLQLVRALVVTFGGSRACGSWGQRLSSAQIRNRRAASEGA